MNNLNAQEKESFIKKSILEYINIDIQNISIKNYKDKTNNSSISTHEGEISYGINKTNQNVGSILISPEETISIQSINIENIEHYLLHISIEKSAINNYIQKIKVPDKIKDHLKNYIKLENTYNKKEDDRSYYQIGLNFELKNKGILLTSLHLNDVNAGITVVKVKTGSGRSSFPVSFMHKMLDESSYKKEKEYTVRKYDFNLMIDKDLNFLKITSSKIEKMQEHYKNFPNILESLQNDTLDDIIALMEIYDI